MSDSKLSMKEIARLAKTSVATVSRVINRNGRFSPETEKRVRDVIEQYGYQPNMLAKGLREDRMKMIGVFVSDISNDFFAHIVKEIEAELIKHNYMTILCDTHEQEEVENRFVDMLSNLRFSGLIYVGGKRSKSKIEGLPIVYVDRKPMIEQMESGSCFICSDNYRGGYIVGERLARTGKKDLGIVLFEDDLETQHQRLRGFRDALNAHGIPLRNELIYHVDRVDYDCGQLIAKTILDSSPRPGAVFFTSDILALGAMREFLEHGVRIPEDISIIGMDDIPLCTRIYPMLSTVRQSYAEMGLIAARSIVKMIDGDRVPDRVLDVELIERNTIAPAD